MRMGAAWGVYEEGEESCWVRLDALQKVYDRDDFFTDHAEAITPYADELADFVPQGTVYLWSTRAPASSTTSSRRKS